MSARDIIAICQRTLRVYPNDCAAFVRAVAHECRVPIAGDANFIASVLLSVGKLSDGVCAARAAASGQLVIAGLDAPGHGHVAVVVDGPVNRGKYPYAFWGQYHGLSIGNEVLNIGFTRGHGTLNWAFKPDDLIRVKYASFEPVEMIMPRAKTNEGFLIHTFT